MEEGMEMRQKLLLFQERFVLEQLNDRLLPKYLRQPWDQQNHFAYNAVSVDFSKFTKFKMESLRAYLVR